MALSACTHACSILALGSRFVLVVAVGILLAVVQHVHSAGVGTAPRLFYSNRTHVLSWDPAQAEDAVMFATSYELSDIVAFDVDATDDTVYVVEVEHQANSSSTRILMATNGSRPTLLLKNHRFDNVLSIAVDSVTKNVYLIEGNGSRIVVCDTGRPNCADLFSGRDGATSLVLDTGRGDLYWSERHGRVYKGRLDGKVSELFLMEESDKPLDIAMDPLTDRIYWTGASGQVVDYVQLNNQTQGQIEIPTAQTPASLVVSQDYLVWSDVSNDSSILKACFSNGCSERSVLGQTKSATYFNLKASSSSMERSRRNPCQKRPCSHICVISGEADDAFSCLCPRHFALKSRSLCELTVPSFFVAAGGNLFKIPVEAALSNDLSVEDVMMATPQLSAVVADDVATVLYGVTEKGGMPTLISINVSNGFITELWKGRNDEQVSSLQFDPLHRLLYWLNSSKNVIVLFNVDRKELTRIPLRSSRSNSQTVDLAVDFRRGQFYVLLEDGNSFRNRVIERHGFDGELQHELPKMSFKPDRIAVEQSTGNLVLHDSASWTIISFDVQTGASSVIAKDVPHITELHPWLSRTFWVALNQPGFFGVVKPKDKVNHVFRKYWPKSTQAMTFSGLSVKPVKPATCKVNNGGCSHTCIDSIGGNRVCICPDNMTLTDNDNSTCVKRNEPVTCSPKEFTCRNGLQCIPNQQLCDGTAQCDDGSDEDPSTCDAGKCSEDEHLCTISLECLPIHLVCDGQTHCRDSSDEANCTQRVASTEFRLSGVFKITWDHQELIVAGAATSIVVLLAALGYFLWQRRKFTSMDPQHVRLTTLPVTLSNIKPVYG